MRDLLNSKFFKKGNLILVRNDKRFYVNDEITSHLHKKVKILLSPNSRGKFRISDRESLDGTSIVINAKTLDVRLSSGIGNFYPIFYYFEDNLLILSSTIDSLISALKLLKRDISKLDIRGIISSLLFDYPITSHTYYEGIKKSEMGTQVVFLSDRKPMKKFIIWRPVFEKEEYKNLSYSSLQEKAKEVIFSLKDNIPQERCIIPLTGGYDSRLLACLLRERYKGEIISYTFQRGPSFETFCAKQIAKRLKFNYIIADLDVECYDSFADKIVRDTSGLLTPMHVHGIYACYKYLSGREQKYNRIFGYFGGSITGEMTEDHACPNIIKSPRELIEHYLKNSILRNNSERIYELLLDEIQKIFEEFAHHNSKTEYFHEYWGIVQRQNNLITRLFDYHRKDCGIYAPYAKGDFCDFFLGIPQKYRYERKLFIETGQQIWPQVFSLPSTDFNETFSGKMLKNIRRVSNLMQYSLDSIFGNQEIFKSPFIYEQHSALLRSKLAAKLKHAYSILTQDILNDLDLPENYLMPIRGANIPEAFRVLTIAIMYKNMNRN